MISFMKRARNSFPKQRRSVSASLALQAEIERVKKMTTLERVELALSLPNKHPWLSANRFQSAAMKTTLFDKGKVALPIDVIEQLKWKEGTNIEVSINDQDTIVIRRVPEKPNQELVDHLLACPHPIDLTPRSRL